MSEKKMDKDSQIEYLVSVLRGIVHEGSMDNLATIIDIAYALDFWRKNSDHSNIRPGLFSECVKCDEWPCCGERQDSCCGKQNLLLDS